MPNNLRVIYNNIADSSNTLTASSTAGSYAVSNTKNDTKGSVWRSALGVTSVNIDLTWNTNQSISSVILPYTNLTNTATIRIRLYSDTAFAFMIYDSGTGLAVPAVFANLYTSTANYRYGFGGGSCARRYFPQLNNCRGLRIDIVDASNTDTYLEISRIIAGIYWSPTYNTEFGLSVGIADSSTKFRTQAGNLVTDNGTSNKTMSFSLNYMLKSDRDVLFNIISTIGSKRSIYISLFPEDEDPTRELIHQIYGRLSDQATISHPMYTIYASSITIEEV